MKKTEEAKPDEATLYALPEHGKGTIEHSINVVESKVWALIDRLAHHSYESIEAQLDDVVAAGKMAEEVKKLREARRIVQRHELETIKQAKEKK